ncbi:MAG: MFS transporter [Pseudomonadota bacterium]
MIFDRAKAVINRNFPSLSHNNFRYLFTGQVISLVGTWMQIMAQAWLVYTITNSAFKLGIVSAMQFLPTLLFSLFAGALVDKMPKKKILIVTQALSMLQALVLFALVYTGYVEYWHVIVLAFLLGCTNAVDMPAGQSYIIELVGRQDVVNAVGLNSAIFNLARVVGPAIAGVLMTNIGIEWCFFINAFSFVPTIIALFMVTQKWIPNGDKHQGIIDEIKDGLSYIYRTPALFKTLLIIIFVTMVGYNFNVLTPVFAKTVLRLKEQGFGMLLSFFGVGSIIGALITSTRFKEKGPRPKLLMLISVLMGAALVCFGFSKSIYAAAFFMTLCGVFGVMFFTMSNSILQVNSADKYRGRVMSVYAIGFGGAMPIGNFVTGFIAEHVGAGATLISTGIIIIFIVSTIRLVRAYW